MNTTAGNSTTVPNWLFDEVIRGGSCAQFKIAAAVIRCTLGRGHREASLSNRFLAWFTDEGLGTVERGIEEALKRGYIVRRPFGEGWAYRVADFEQIRFVHDLSFEVLTPDQNR